jgi:hypothetical protein
MRGLRKKKNTTRGSVKERDSLMFICWLWFSVDLSLGGCGHAE